MNSENPTQREILRLLSNLKQTFRFSGTDEAGLLEVWHAGLSGLTDAQIQKAEQKLYQEKTAGFMPTPGEFRAYAQAEQYKHSGGAQHIEWWTAKDSDGRAIAWYDGLKDSEGNAVSRDPELIWTRAREQRQGIPVNQILDACGMENCTGKGQVDLRMDHTPGPRLRIKCNVCGVATEWFDKTRQAITRWNGE